MTPPVLTLALDADAVYLICDKVRVPITHATKVLTRNFGTLKNQLVVIDGHLTAQVQGGSLPSSCWAAVGLPTPSPNGSLRDDLEHLVNAVVERRDRRSATTPDTQRKHLQDQEQGATPSAKRARVDIIRGRLRELEESLEKDLGEEDCSDTPDPTVLQEVSTMLNISDTLDLSHLKHPRKQVGLCVLHLLIEGHFQLIRGNVMAVVEHK
jgi:hypothetical protein